MSSVTPNCDWSSAPLPTSTIEVGAHGAWTKVQRRMEATDRMAKREAAVPSITTNYALWRMTHEGRTARAA